MSVSRRESIYRETLPKQHSFQFLTEGDQSRRIPNMSRQRVPGSCCSRRENSGDEHFGLLFGTVRYPGCFRLLEIGLLELLKIFT